MVNQQSMVVPFDIHSNYLQNRKMISDDLDDKLILDDLHFDEQEDKQTQREIRIVELKLILQQQMNQMKKIEQEVCFSFFSSIVSIKSLI